jgi:hypothetical protein
VGHQVPATVRVFPSSPPSLPAILAIGLVQLIAYLYWRDVRMFPSWCTGVSGLLLSLAALASAALVVTAAVALPRHIGGTDEAANGGW